MFKFGILKEVFFQHVLQMSLAPFSAAYVLSTLDEFIIREQCYLK